MKTQKLRRTIAALTLGALAAYPGMARADDTAAEIRLLKERLKQLEKKVSDQARKEKETQEIARKAAAQAAAAPAPGAPSPYTFPIGIGVPPQPGLELPPIPGNRKLVKTEEQLKGYPTLGPSTLYVGGVTITPGGFFELASVARSRFIGADIATPWQNIPFANVPTTHTGEFRLSARRSRVAALVRGDVTPTTHLAGYGEFDWLSAAQTANLNQSDSFNLRIRHLYITVDNDDFGAHLLAGHAFTLATMNIVGILPRKENTPIVIEDQYVPGFVWDRQDQIRIVKDFDKTLWFAFSVEQPATSFGGTVPTSPAGLNVVNVLPGALPCVPGNPGNSTGTVCPNANGQIIGGSLFNSINPLSLNQMPDLIGKVAYDPTFGDRTIHMEAFGMFRSFVDVVSTPLGGKNFVNHNDNSSGWGFGGSILVPIIPQVLEGQFSGLIGRGIGRYGAAQLPDVTFNPNGSLNPIPETMLLAGLVYHALPGLDIYTYAGQEQQSAKYGFTSTGQAIGWGNPAFNNAGCGVEFSVTCSGNTKLVRQITGGFWQDLYKGPFGRLTGGLQYSYTQRVGYFGAGFSPVASDNMFFTSLRYYPF